MEKNKLFCLGAATTRWLQWEGRSESRNQTSHHLGNHQVRNATQSRWDLNFGVHLRLQADYRLPRRPRCLLWELHLLPIWSVRCFENDHNPCPQLLRLACLQLLQVCAESDSMLAIRHVLQHEIVPDRRGQKGTINQCADQRYRCVR